MAMNLVMECTADMGLRKTIRAHGISASPRLVSVADVGKNNDEYQTRSAGGDLFSPPLVAEYAVAMRAGVVFPELLLVAHDSRLSIVCGAHRISAMRAVGITGFRALVVAAVAGDIWQLRAISAEDNNTHGMRQSTAAAVQIATNEILAMPLPTGAHEQPYAVVKIVADRYRRCARIVKKNYCKHLAKNAIAELGMNAGKTTGLDGALEKCWVYHGNTPAFAAIAGATLLAGPRGQAEKILDLAKKNKTAPADIPGLILDTQPVIIGPLADPMKNALAAAERLARSIGRLHGATVGPAIADTLMAAVNACQTVCVDWVATQ